MNKDLVRVQMNSQIIEAAENVFKKNNLTAREAVTLLYENILLKPEFPFPLQVEKHE